MYCNIDNFTQTSERSFKTFRICLWTEKKPIMADQGQTSWYFRGGGKKIVT